MRCDVLPATPLSNASDAARFAYSPDGLAAAPAVGPLRVRDTLRVLGVAGSGGFV